MNTIGENILNNQDMSGTLVSSEANLNNLLHYAIHAVWTGTPVGNLFLEANTEFSGNTWEILATVAVSGADSQMWLDRNAPYAKVRIRYVPTSGVGTLNATFLAKGDL